MAEIESEDIMKQFYGIGSNGNSPVKIKNDELNEIISKHFNKKYHVFRCNELKAVIKEIVQNGYKYLPLYTKEGEKFVPYIVTSSKYNGIKADIDFNQCYVNPMPCHLTERMRRINEIMIWE